ncbi:MAG: hypothetical protein ACTHK8_21510 [Ginsengibacter sp.]
MKVLIVAEYDDGNTVIKSYVDGIRQLSDVKSSVSDFWDCKTRFDIIHIHWPELLFKWMPVEEGELQKLELTLEHWKRAGAKIVVTRHNSKSHRNLPLDDQLYEIVFKNADAFVHLGENSYNEFIGSPLYGSKVNVQINHPNYFGIKIQSTRNEARKKLGFKENAVVYLAFGAMRHAREERDLISAFKKLDLKNKKLLIARSFLFKSYISFKKYPIKRLKNEMEKFMLRMNKIEVKASSHIRESEMTDLFLASDVILIPRLNQLNSGQLYLAFSFARIVVGPEIGNIGTTLRRTGNFLFKPGNESSYVSALQKAAAHIHTRLGTANYQYAASECDIHKIGKEHLQLYSVLGKGNIIAG